MILVSKIPYLGNLSSLLFINEKRDAQFSFLFTWVIGLLARKIDVISTNHERKNLFAKAIYCDLHIPIQFSLFFVGTDQTIVEPLTIEDQDKMMSEILSLLGMKQRPSKSSPHFIGYMGGKNTVRDMYLKKLTIHSHDITLT